MNTEKIAKGWALIAEGAMELSLAYESLDTPAARAGAVAGEGATAGQPSSPAALPDLPPLLDEDGRELLPATPPPMKPQVDAGLGVCPTHGVPWTVKAAGVGKNGKRYSAFWKCAERDGDKFCDEKPQPIWKDAHPISEGVAA